jgi:hypothetical protein
MRGLFAFVLVSLAAAFDTSSSAQTPGATYSINFYAITAGGNTLRGKCFVVSGSVAQIAPGYSSGGIYALYSGYQFPVTPSSATGDEIFFNGFEGCGQ